jgi:hypothetical protein
VGVTEESRKTKLCKSHLSQLHLLQLAGYFGIMVIHPGKRTSKSLVFRCLVQAALF